MTFQRAATAGLWSTAELVARQGIGFVAVIFLARLLSPDDFGVFALAVLVIALVSALINGGLSALIVQRSDLSDRDLDRIFSFALLLSCGAAVPVGLSGYLLAQFYGQPVLQILMPALALHPVVSATGLVQTALFQKQLHFKPMARIGWISGVVGGGLAVAMAFSGFKIWALVAQIMVSTSLNTILVFRASDWRPNLTFDLKPLMPSLRYAGPVSLAQGLHIFYIQGFALIIGRRYSAADIGLFNRGFATTQLPQQLFAGLVGKVSLPLFSERADDHAAIISGTKRGLAGIMLLSTPAFVGLAMLAPDIIRLLYGEQWTAAAPILTILALAGILMPLQSANVHLLLAKGMSKTYLRIEIAKKTLGIAFVVTASFHGIVAVAFAYLVASLCWLGLNTRYTNQIIGFGLLDQLRHLRGIFVASAIMAGFLALIQQQIDLPIAAKLPLSIIAGAAVYFCAGFALRIEAFDTGLSDVNQLLARLRDKEPS